MDLSIVGCSMASRKQILLSHANSIRDTLIGNLLQGVSVKVVGPLTLSVAGDFYNTSSSEDIAPYTGTPYGFHSRPMLGFPSGFPAVFNNRLSQSDVQRLLTILHNGSFLDDATATVTARMLTFNSEEQVYG